MGAYNNYNSYNSHGYGGYGGYQPQPYYPPPQQYYHPAPYYGPPPQHYGGYGRYNQGGYHQQNYGKPSAQYKNNSNKWGNRRLNKEKSIDKIMEREAAAATQAQGSSEEAATTSV